MRLLENGEKLTSCHECPYQVKDQYNPSRLYCEKLSERFHKSVEICVNLDFPIVCPLEKV